MLEEPYDEEMITRVVSEYVIVLDLPEKVQIQLDLWAAIRNVDPADILAELLCQKLETMFDEEGNYGTE